MNKVGTSIFFVLMLLVCSLQLHRKKALWKKSTAELNQHMFSNGNSCVIISKHIYAQYSQILPKNTTPDSLKSALLYQLFDAVGYMDDFGVDKKYVSINENERTLLFYSARDSGYTLIIRYRIANNCITLLAINGLKEILGHHCLDQHSPNL
jgi:hypothetical protein